MLFNSYLFVFLFLPLSVSGYFILNHYKWHRAALLELALMSFLFYAYNNVTYVLLLGISILCNWGIACLLNRIKKYRFRKIVLFSGILLNVGSIFYFKYFDFFIGNFNVLFGTDFELRNIILPLGISFFTFQQISYLVDTERGETKDYCFIEYAAFVSFFPQLVAGPIVLHSEIIPQFRDEKRHYFDHESFSNGIYRFAVGLFKKVIIADTFGKAVTWGWSNTDMMTSLEIMIVMLSYTFQIYFDFSGYCDMAMGIGKMFHIELPANFNSPYQSCSIIEFWKRWHMTLTRFLRNYIYFPLGGSRKGKIRTYINIMIVFLISGLWHGANWTFVIWGLCHGLAQVLNRIFATSWEKCHQAFQWLCTFAFVNVMWLLFRAENVKQAVMLLKQMLKMESFTISRELCDSFILPEIDFLVDLVKPLANLRDKVYGIYMWFCL